MVSFSQLYTINSDWSHETSFVVHPLGSDDYYRISALFMLAYNGDLPVFAFHDNTIYVEDCEPIRLPF